jgi:hypothetical protein
MNIVTVQEVVWAMMLMGAACGYFGFILGRYFRSNETEEIVESERVRTAP